jgi:hypothetical protein
MIIGAGPNFMALPFVKRKLPSSQLVQMRLATCRASCQQTPKHEESHEGLARSRQF